MGFQHIRILANQHGHHNSTAVSCFPPAPLSGFKNCRYKGVRRRNFTYAKERWALANYERLSAFDLRMWSVEYPYIPASVILLMLTDASDSAWSHYVLFFVFALAYTWAWNNGTLAWLTTVDQDHLVSYFITTTSFFFMIGFGVRVGQY